VLGHASRHLLRLVFGQILQPYRSNLLPIDDKRVGAAWAQIDNNRPLTYSAFMSCSVGGFQEVLEVVPGADSLADVVV
jgi:hypothetical protein